MSVAESTNEIFLKNLKRTENFFDEISERQPIVIDRSNRKMTRIFLSFLKEKKKIYISRMRPGIIKKKKR